MRVWNNAALPLTSFPSQSLRLSSIPDKLYIFARPSKGGLTGTISQTTPDTFLRITNLQINYNNRISILYTLPFTYLSVILKIYIITYNHLS